MLALWRDDTDRPSPTDTASALEGLLRRDPRSLLVAEANGEIVGALIVGWDGWRGSFYRLAVDRGRRRQGIATALVRTGEDRLRRLGAVRLTAVVVAEEAAAISLWSSLGYTRQADTTRFVRMVGPVPGERVPGER